MSDVEGVLSAYPRIYFACHQRHVRDPVGGGVLSAHRASILSHLDGVDPTMVTELAEHLAVTASTMSLTLKRLEAAGYVRRDRDPADRRVINVRLTEAGERVREAQSVLEPELVGRMLMELDPAKRVVAIRGLGLLAEAADGLVRRGRHYLEAPAGGGGTR